MAKVKITETALRDSHQSLIATRMTTEEMLPILKDMDEVGYHSLEVWGGATFDACLRFLNEDPWVRLRKIREVAKNTNLQMLFRGQNILGYRHYSDDVVEYFVQKSIANGIDIIRIFDALNDARNLETAIKATNREHAQSGKGHVQVALSYTTGPIYTTDYYVNYTRQLVDMGVDSICIKDMAGLLKPYDAEVLVKAIKERFPTLPVELHTHYTAGLASMTTLKAIEAGCDIVDTAISPLALGTSQPATEPIVAALQGTPYDTGLDLVKLDKISKYFSTLREKYLASGLLNPKVLKVDANTLLYQVPGGMLSNLISQLAQMGKSDKLQECLEEVPRVRADAGYPPLVTPSSQIVGTQAVMNVIYGERYKSVTKEFKGMIKGEYGRPAVPIDPDFQKKILGDEQPSTCRPADLLKPELEDLKTKVAPYAEQEEDVLSYALFEQVATKFFDARKAAKLNLDEGTADKQAKIHTV